MTINSKIHARLWRMRTCTYALMASIACINTAMGQPIDVSGSGNEKTIIIGNDGIAHVPPDVQAAAVQSESVESADAQSDSTQNASFEATDAQTVERPDLQPNLELANLGNVNPERFGDAVVNSQILSTTPVDPSTKRYSAAEISALIDSESAKLGLDPAYVRLVADIESQFNQFALSETGAIGIMQLMPDTVSEFGVKNPYDAAQNIRGGVSYLKQLLDEFHNPLMAAAAYHCGPQAARNANGIPEGPRTAKYMVRLLNDYYRISESSFMPAASAVAPLVTPVAAPDATSVSFETTAGITPLPRNQQHRANKVLQPVQNAGASEPGTPYWEAGFVMNLD